MERAVAYEAEGKAPWLFLLLAIALMAGMAYFMGNRPLTVPFLNVTATIAVFLTFVPIVLALIFTLLEGGPGGVSSLLARLLPSASIGPRWYAVSILLMPVLQVGAYLAALAGGATYGQHTPLSTLLLVVPLLLFAVAEEVGWTGYATGPLQRRYGALGAALVIGTGGIVIHLIPYIAAGHNLSWVLGQSLLIIEGRIIMVWVFNNTGRSILPAVLMHAGYNLAYIMYPYNGSSYDPVLLSAVQGVVVAAILIATRGSLSESGSVRPELAR
jgi:membrane protease YdiL (CAAX protease family)